MKSLVFHRSAAADSTNSRTRKAIGKRADRLLSLIRKRRRGIVLSCRKIPTIDLPMISLTDAPIDYCELTESVRSKESGAVVLFLGTVREMTEGRRTIALDYEAYPEMARAKMMELETRARSKWQIDQIGIVHRLGHLHLGEISVAIAVSCPHRKQAFEACQFVIDELKASVPIWKQENWSDGTTEWVHPERSST